jgi:hypothetical protein
MPDTPERCTCGSVLAENARFCHRCGRPVHELTAAEQAEFAPTPPPAPAPAVIIQAPLPISFGNPIALRVAFVMAFGVMLTSFLPLLNVFILIWCLLAGWGGVRLYRRLTGLRLSVAAGARLGFLTGVFASVSLTVVIALGMATSGKEILDQLTTQMVKQDPRMSEVVNNPTMLGAALLFMVVLIFVMIVGICAAGGALGAKFASPTPPQSQPRA